MDYLQSHSPSTQNNTSWDTFYFDVKSYSDFSRFLTSEMVVFHKHELFFGVHRESTRPRATSGRSPWRYGRSWCCALRGRSRSWRTSKWWRTAATGTKATASRGWCLGHRRVRGRSTTWWASAGSARRRTGRASPRSTSSCSARTSATSPPLDKPTQTLPLPFYEPRTNRLFKFRFNSENK